MRLSAGAQLGPYEIVVPVGAGGMGEVYRARDRRIGRDVALKVLPASLMADADRLRRFKREAQAVGQLNHPNILTLHDVGIVDGTPFLVTELLEGESLRDHLRSQALPWSVAAGFALQIARGLAAAHDKGIIHRDLKPENLFVTKDGRVKILDFGLAKLTRRETPNSDDQPPLTENTAIGAVMGSMGYMPPEQVRGQVVDHRADIFSFGVLLHEMLSGERPFRGDTPADTMSAILTADSPDLAPPGGGEIPPALVRIARRCLEKRREDRFQSARDLVLDLEDLSRMSEHGREPAPAPTSSGPALIAVLAGVALLALLAAILGLHRGRGQAPVSWLSEAVPSG